MTRRQRPSARRVAAVLLTLVLGTACAARQDLAPSQQLGLAGLSFFETVGQVGRTVSALEGQGVVPTATALRVHERLLEINGSAQPFTDGLRYLDQVERLGATERAQVTRLLDMMAGFEGALGDLLPLLGQDDERVRVVVSLVATARDTLAAVRDAVEAM